MSTGHRRRDGRGAGRGLHPPRSAPSTSSSTTRAASSARSGQPIEEVTDEDWSAVVDANLTSTFLCTRAAVPGMKRRGYGPHRQHLVRRGPQRQPHRHPGVRQREGRADRLHPPDGSRAGPFGITVNASRPGSSSRTRPSIKPVGELRRGRARRALLERIATRRLGTPEDIAHGVRFFVSESLVLDHRPDPLD